MSSQKITIKKVALSASESCFKPSPAPTSPVKSSVTSSPTNRTITISKPVINSKPSNENQSCRSNVNVSPKKIIIAKPKLSSSPNKAAEKNVVEIAAGKGVVFGSFPYKPYDIQQQFMENMYSVLESGGVGIFESPTGTGKSLSLLCSAAQWLKDYNAKENMFLNAAKDPKEMAKLIETLKDDPRFQLAPEEATGTKWIDDFAVKQKIEQEVRKKEDDKKKLEKLNARVSKLRQVPGDSNQLKATLQDDQRPKKRALLDLTSPARSYMSSAERKKIKTKAIAMMEQGENYEENEELYLLEPYNEDDDVSTRVDCSEDADEESKDNNEEDDIPNIQKIYYASRTHSQLSQFVQEFQKIDEFNIGEFPIKLVSLASRKALCINKDVQKLKSNNKINDACLELKKKRDETKKSEAGCPYLLPSAQQLFSDFILSKAQDIEDLATEGNNLKTCPYYATRKALPAAELVVVAYNTIFHKPTREALGINLKDNIVIVDEAHNLIDAIAAIHSVCVPISCIVAANSQLSSYLQKYSMRLGSKNLAYINQILVILAAMARFLGVKLPTLTQLSSTAIVDGSGSFLTTTPLPIDRQPEEVLTLNEFVFSTKIDNLNLFKILKYIKKSEIVRKLNGFTEHFAKNNIAEVVIHNSHKSTEPTNESAETGLEIGADDEFDDDNWNTSRPAMGRIESFLEALTNISKDGRILISRKFLLLNPEQHFREITDEARAVVLAGGTMQPIGELVRQLLGDGTSAEILTSINASAAPTIPKLHVFSCGHIVPKENVLAMVVANGSSGVPLDLNFKTRSQSAIIEEIGNAIVSICRVVPDGVVVFFPSYGYEKEVFEHWRNSKNGDILSKLETIKKVFREPKQAVDVEKVLEQYKATIENTYPSQAKGSNNHLTGALLSCVVGGKMSEGINFGDGLGRCVVVVGMPYPNPTDPVLIEKMKFISTTAAELGPYASQEYYENLCMKAVNQSIGRAVRHINDYSTIVLMDQRYKKPSVINKLPAWITNKNPSENIRQPEKFNEAILMLNEFFQKEKFRSMQLQFERLRLQKKINKP